MADGLSRRSILQGLAATAATVGTVSLSAAPASAAAAAAQPKPKPPGTDWAAFDAAVRSAFDRMNMVGAALALVSAGEVLHTTTLGSRMLAPRRPVTTTTRFDSGSTGKSMTAAFVATYVDDGTLAWDQPVVDAWSGFRAPTDELTRTLRVRDLIGMASGLREPPSTSSHFGGVTAAQLLQSVVNLPVVDSHVDKTFFYNNTMYALGGYLPLLATGVAPADLGAARSQAIHERLFTPAGMPGVILGSDPRGLSDDYAAGHQFDLRARAGAIPYAPFGAYGPSGAGYVNIEDMAAWVRLQLRQGVSVNGRRVVSAANLAECWKPHVPASLLPPELDPDAVSVGYAMGWIREEYKGGSSLVWHNGAFDGFTAFVGFLPQHDLGLTVLNNMTAGPAGIWFYTYVLNLVLSERFGLNVGVPDKVLATEASALDDLRTLGSKAKPVSFSVVAPYLGYYEGGYSLVREGRDVVLHNSSRAVPLQVMPDGSYVMSEGFMVGAAVKLARETDGTPHIEIVGIETVRRTTGLG